MDDSKSTNNIYMWPIRNERLQYRIEFELVIYLRLHKNKNKRNKNDDNRITFNNDVCVCCMWLIWKVYSFIYVVRVKIIDIQIHKCVLKSPLFLFSNRFQDQNLSSATLTHTRLHSWTRRIRFMSCLRLAKAIDVTYSWVNWIKIWNIILSYLVEKDLSLSQNMLQFG